MVLSGLQSKPALLQNGVPKRSVLGPVLFALNTQSVSHQSRTQRVQNSTATLVLKEKRRYHASYSPSPVPQLRGSLRHRRWLHNQFPPFFSVFHCHLGLGELKAYPFPDVIFPLLPLSALSSSPFHSVSQDAFATLDERETCLYHFSLRLFTMVKRSSCGPIASWSWHGLPRW